LRSAIVTDTTPPPRSNDPANDGYELRYADEARRDAGSDADDEVREAGLDVDKARTIRQRISDAIEDVIPGDSDNDGH
jgi:ribosomal protein L13E